MRAQRTAIAALVLLVASSCASIRFDRDTQTSGTFRSTGLSFTIISLDMPKSALDIARENVSDARQPNAEIQETRVWPYLGPLDWLLDIVGVRYAVVTGTWGYSSE